MNEFDELKNRWQQSTPPASPVDTQSIQRANVPYQQALERTQLRGAILLLLTAAYLVYFGFFSRMIFHATTTYVAIVLMVLCCVGQGLVGLYRYHLLRSIDVSAPVTEHLHQWELYYTFRQRLLRINLPLYYLFLNGAFALYFIEVLGPMSLNTRIVSLTLYIAWVFFAWFVLGKRSLRREQDRLDTIMGKPASATETAKK